ncbi:MAG TPA: NBR1-Ig-like domain-containing protein [Micromonosporaceae bacterium]|nr:NBR1-Ig-like domain-containing protein [Micromonosporaceae bacterium]
MRELREGAAAQLSEVAVRSGWHKSHLSRVERGLSKPSQVLVQWYDGTFGGNGALLQQYLDLEAAVASDRQQTRRDVRHVPLVTDAYPVRSGGSVPCDYDRDDRCFLVSETVPDGTLMWTGEVFRKEWMLQNAGPTCWRGRWLSRQGRPGVAGWLRSPERVRVSDTPPGDTVTVRVDLQAPDVPGACTAYFKMTDADGRPYFPGSVFEPLHCTVMTQWPE